MRQILNSLKIFSLVMFLTTACQAMPVTANGSHGPYPDDWWKPVPRPGAPAWEVLPQDAGPGEVILSKRTELGILSNFAPTPFVYRGKRYASVEGFWQMMKYPEGPNDERLKNPNVRWQFTREQVSQMTAFDAKNAGSLANENMKKLGIQWVTLENTKINYLENAKGLFYRIIWEVEWEKIRQNPQVQQILLKTGTLILRPDHIQEPNAAPA